MKKLNIDLRKPTQMQRIALAMAFVGEHKEQFEEWVKSKKTIEQSSIEEENEDVI